MSFSLPLDFILSFRGDKIPDHGEDSYCYCFCDSAGLLGAFDGCGGAGARTHEAYSGHTEAYMASRLCAGAFYDAFRKLFPCEEPTEQLLVNVFLPEALNRLRAYAPAQDTTLQIRGSIVRTLPTTAAVAILRQMDPDAVTVSAVWAGDSRIYVLDAHGLSQLTVDDTSVPDPMENLYEDGILKNIFCSDKAVRLRCNTVQLQPPFLVFAATDGCFGYVSTPMEFEGLLLHTLLQAPGPAQWEESLAEYIGKTAGDDHTLCMASLGYGSFEALQKDLSPRFEHLKQNYLLPLRDLPLDDRQSRYDLWAQYKHIYNRYLKDREM